MASNASADTRDRGLTLISRINRWMIAGAVALAGLISLIASHSFHGRTLSSGASQTSSSSSRSSAGSSSNSTGSIQQPVQPPASVPAPVVPSAPVVSGGS